MNDMKTEPVLITSLTRRLTAIRNEAFSLIQNAVAKHRILGTFYQNLGKHYAHDQTLEQYDTAPIVITHNDSFGTYGHGIRTFYRREGPPALYSERRSGRRFQRTSRTYPDRRVTVHRPLAHEARPCHRQPVALRGVRLARRAGTNLGRYQHL